MPDNRLPCTEYSHLFDEIIEAAPSVGGRGRPDPWALEEAASLCEDCPFFTECVLGVHREEFWAQAVLAVRRRRMRQRLRAS